VRQLLRAHEYWRMKGLGRRPGDPQREAAVVLQDLQTTLERWSATGRPIARRDAGRRGHRPARRSLSRERDCLAAAARAVLLSRQGTLASRSARPNGRRRAARARAAAERERDRHRPAPPRPTLEFVNGLGGFVEDGREYVDRPRRRALDAGAVDQRDRERASASRCRNRAAGYTWAVNSRENQLTPGRTIR
jgi:cyclic beta-1,2-glucan synthetase